MKQMEIEAKIAELTAGYSEIIRPFQEANDELRVKLYQMEMEFLGNKNSIKEKIRQNEDTIRKLKTEHLKAKAEMIKRLSVSEE